MPKKRKPSRKATRPKRKSGSPRLPTVASTDWGLSRLRLSLITPEVLKSLDHAEADARACGLDAMHVKPTADENVVLNGQQASEALEQAMGAVGTRLRETTGLLPAHAWLRYLRACPGEIFNDPAYRHPGSYLERRVVAECLSAIGSASDDMAIDLGRVPVDELIRFCGQAKVFANFRVLHRISSKDVPMSFAPDEAPSPLWDDPRMQAIQVLDERLTAQSGLHLLAGTVANESLASMEGAQPGFVVATSHRDFVPLHESLDATQPLQAGGFIRDWGFWSSGLFTRVLPLVRDFGIDYRSNLLFEELMLNGLSMYCRAKHKEVAADIARYGYFSAPEDLLMLRAMEFSTSEFARGVGEALGVTEDLYWDELLAVALEEPRLSPYMPGPVVRRDGKGGLLFDCAANTSRLTLKLSLHHDGGNTPTVLRSKDFEKRVQALIDTSTWRPPPELRRLVDQQNLKLADGTVLTDLDCLAVKEGVGLLIDAASFASPRAITGEWGPTRDVRLGLERKWTKWQVQIATLAETPVTNSYDFSALRKLLPLIVTPGPQFVHQDLLEPPVIGPLRPVTSLSELADFLGVTMPS